MPPTSTPSPDEPTPTPEEAGPQLPPPPSPPSPQETPPQRLGVLPRLPAFLRPPSQQASPSASQSTVPPSPPTASSPVSTDRPPPPPPPPPAPKRETVPIKDLQDAVSQFADIAFVVLGAVVGPVVSRLKKKEHDKRDWTPTSEERAGVVRPAGRIVGRHVKGDTAKADALDAVLMAAGVGRYGARTIFELDPLEPLDPDKEKQKT